MLQLYVQLRVFFSSLLHITRTLLNQVRLTFLLPPLHCCTSGSRTSSSVKTRDVPDVYKLFENSMMSAFICQA